MDVSPTIQHPHGRLRLITGTNPAAGAEISETVPDRRRWRIISIRFSLIADANAANRTVIISLDDGTTNFMGLASDTFQTASQTRFYNYRLQPVPQFLVGTDFHLPLPHVFLGPGYRIKTVTTNIQIGDDYGAPILFIEEWIDP